MPVTASRQEDSAAGSTGSLPASYVTMPVMASIPKGKAPGPLDAKICTREPSCNLSTFLRKEGVDSGNNGVERMNRKFVAIRE